VRVSDPPAPRPPHREPPNATAGVPAPAYADFPPPPVDAVPAGFPPPGEQPEPPPVRRRPPWLPLLVPLLALSLVAGALFVTDRIGRAATGSTVTTFLPADGTSWTEQVRRSGPAGDRTDTAVTESAHIAGSAITSATDWTLATQLIGAANSDRASLDRGRFWRTTTIVPARSSAEASQTRIYRAEQDWP
jgi:hypothetical protein